MILVKISFAVNETNNFEVIDLGVDVPAEICA